MARLEVAWLNPEARALSGSVTISWMIASVLGEKSQLAVRMPTYVTLKEVKKRWGHGQEDVYPVAQFEKLWGDMTALTECINAFAVVPRARGQQLKDQAQLDGWLRDGSAAYTESLCDWE